MNNKKLIDINEIVDIKSNFYLRTAKTYFNYKLNRFNPFAIFLFVTSRCNLRCPYCLTVGINKPNHELKNREIFRIIEDASDLGVSYISLTGGEPLIRRDIIGIIKKVKKEGMKVSLSTNAHFITPEKAEELCELTDYIRVSMYGFEETHNKMRGINSYSKAYEGLTNLLSVKNRKAKVGLICVVNDLTLPILHNFFYYFKDKVDSINFQPLNLFSGVYSNRQFDVVWKKLYDDKSGKLTDFEDFVGVPSMAEGLRVCAAAKLYLTISAVGDVYPCLIERGLKIGNIREKSLKELWNSEKINNVREQTKKCIGCYSKCTTEISKIFQQSPVQLLRRFPKMQKTWMK